jgi:hypothetical protein
LGCSFGCSDIQEGQDELPPGVKEEAQQLVNQAIRENVEISYDARWTLYRLAGLPPPPPE